MGHGCTTNQCVLEATIGGHGRPTNQPVRGATTGGHGVPPLQNLAAELACDRVEDFVQLVDILAAPLGHLGLAAAAAVEHGARFTH